MAELDHIVYACRDVDAGTRTIQELTGATAVVGGPHVGRGTHNTLLTFDDRTYFEIIGIDPNQPEPPNPRGFGLDQLEASKLVAYAVHPVGGESLEDVTSVLTHAGFNAGQIMDMSRRKPDGELLEWRLSTGGDTAHGLDGALPFVIDWLGRPSPATELPSMGTLMKLTVTNPDPRIARVVAELGLADTVEVVEGPVNLKITIDTPNGLVTLG